MASALALGVAALLLTPATAGAATTLVVSPVNGQGWTPQHATCLDPPAVGTGSQAFVTGPDTPPLGTGSYQLSIGTDGMSFEAVRLAAVGGTRLQDLTTLSYSTYVTAPVMAAYLIINLDLNGDGVTDDQLIWEPYYQATVIPGTWQRWDAIGSLWWSPYVPQAAWSGQFNPVPLAEYLSLKPHTADVTIATGGIRIAAGCGWGDSNFVGYADAFTIGVSGVETTYDFEPYSPFNGFFQPVDNLPTLNTVKAGSAIPVKFSLGGYAGMDIFAAGSPASIVDACDASGGTDAVEVTLTAGSSSLQYDATTDTYTYVWKTNKTWAGTCRQLQVKLVDGSVHAANFKLTK